MKNYIIVLTACVIGIFLISTGCENHAQTYQKLNTITRKIDFSTQEPEKQSPSKKPEFKSIKKAPQKTKQFVYNPKGKIDPFVPLIQQTASISDNRHRNIESNTKPTPLQNIELSRLKLVAIVRTDSGNKAMVQDSTGKGYIINKGTYIGMDSGKVVNILKQKVILEEKVKTPSGKISVREKELRFPNPL